MKTAAVVISYNRRDALRECLQSLQAQERPLDGIIVIDNASTDGSAEMIKSSFPDVVLEKLEVNLGGAGGFAYGISIAISKGFDYAWLMDDDAVAFPDSVGPLIQAMESRMPNPPGFVAATVVDEHGDLLESHAPPSLRSARNHGLVADDPGYGAPYCTFVGVLINLAIARRTWLPVADFFIWWDDTEYSARLQDMAGGLVSAESRVLHPREGQYQTDRFRIDVRNRVWVIRCRRLGSKWSRHKAWSTFLPHVARQCFRRRASYRRFVQPLVWGLWNGLAVSPRVVCASESPDTALLAIEGAQRRA